MKHRTPGTLEDALLIAVAELGPERCGELIGKSASLIYKATDPDHDHTLNLRQALVIDAACKQISGETPIFSYCLRQLEAVAANRPESASLTELVLDTTTHLGEMCAKVRAFHHEGSEEGRRLSVNERAQIQELQRGMARLLDAIGAVVELEVAA